MSQPNTADNLRYLFSYYKKIADGALNQLKENELHLKPDQEDNSVAVIVKHITGNMLSRFTDFYESDGEKSWRNRDAEFESDIANLDELSQRWNEAWGVLFKLLDQLTMADLQRTIYIRNEALSAEQAFLRQATHYAYHIGQIVYVVKWIRQNEWQSLSIPKGNSASFNAEKFKEEKGKNKFFGNG